MTARPVRQFFDEVAEQYHGKPMGMRAHHELTARTLEDSLSGRVLCTGGLWPQVHLEALPPFVAVADLSLGMLGALPDMTSGALAEARALPFASGCFDHVVFPLVLHHITDNRATAARQCVRDALAEARRVLADGGSIWISEFCLNRAVYSAEILLAPLTRALLALADIPLVVMHSVRFLERALDDAGFTDVEILQLEPRSAGAFDPIQPIIGLPWLRVPRLLYPVTPTLIKARAAAGGT